MECDKSNGLQVFRGSLDRIRTHVRNVYYQDSEAIDQYMWTLCERYREDSIAILEEFNTLIKHQ